MKKKSIILQFQQVAQVREIQIKTSNFHGLKCQQINRPVRSSITSIVGTNKDGTILRLSVKICFEMI